MEDSLAMSFSEKFSLGQGHCFDLEWKTDFQDSEDSIDEGVDVKMGANESSSSDLDGRLEGHDETKENSVIHSEFRNGDITVCISSSATSSEEFPKNERLDPPVLWNGINDIKMLENETNLLNGHHDEASIEIQKTSISEAPTSTDSELESDILKVADEMFEKLRKCGDEEGKELQTVVSTKPERQTLVVHDLKEKIFINLTNSSPKRNLESISEEESLSFEYAPKTEVEEEQSIFDDDIFGERVQEDIPIQMNSWRSMENLACPDLYRESPKAATKSKVDGVFSNNNKDEPLSANTSECNSCSNEQKNSSQPSVQGATNKTVDLIQPTGVPQTVGVNTCIMGDDLTCRPESRDLEQHTEMDKSANISSTSISFCEEKQVLFMESVQESSTDFADDVSDGPDERQEENGFTQLQFVPGRTEPGQHKLQTIFIEPILQSCSDCGEIGCDHTCCDQGNRVIPAGTCSRCSLSNSMCSCSHRTLNSQYSSKTNVAPTNRSRSSSTDIQISSLERANPLIPDNNETPHPATRSQNTSGFVSADNEPQFSTMESGFCDLEVENKEVLDDDDDECFVNQEVVGRRRNTVLHTSPSVKWEGDYMCTCEECLEGLTIERITTSDKSTMCPEEPPYILLCDICDEILNGQLQKLEKDSKKKEDSLKREIKELKKDNEAAQKIINQNLQLGPEAKIEATMQHEITRLTSENLDLRENMDKQADQIRKMKKMLKVYSKKLKDGEAAEIAAELEKDDRQVDNVASVKHKDRSYMGMLEYKKEDETVLIKNLIMDLKPKVASGLLPGLPAYVLFMCVRHTDYTNDDEKVRSLLTHTINGIKKCVKKHHTDLERVTLWLANSCRLLHTLKQYSGDKAFQSENSSRQNEHCLRNFDLSEYRQVISDLAVWIYQTMIKQMEETLQPMVVPAVLEHEAIAGLSAAKPSGMRGRSSSTTDEVRELSLDSLMKTLNKYSQVLNSHAVDPELTKQIFRQIYYFVCAGALNNLLLRKDMCNWSKGMQIRYNLSHLEQWLRDNKLQESGAQGTLEPIIQASQLLQARKTVDDVDSICEMCSKLSTPQIVKILNLYTPVDEFEERVPISFIRKIQEKLKQREDGESDNTLLMDTKYSFPVTFPFNPSSVSLDSVEVPQALHLGFLTRV